MKSLRRLTALFALALLTTGAAACGKGGTATPDGSAGGGSGGSGGAGGGSAGAAGGSAGSSAGTAGSSAGSAGSVAGSGGAAAGAGGTDAGAGGTDAGSAGTDAGTAGAAGSDAGATADAASDATAASCVLIANATYYATSGTITGMADGVAFSYTNVTESLIGTNGGFAASAPAAVPRILFDFYYRSATPGTYTCAMQNIGVSWGDGTNSFEARLQRPPSTCEIKLTESGPKGGHVRGTFTATMIYGAKQLVLTGGAFDFVRCTE